MIISWNSFFSTVPKPPKVDPKYIPEEIVVKKGECIELDIPFIGMSFIILTYPHVHLLVEHLNKCATNDVLKILYHKIKNPFD